MRHSRAYWLNLLRFFLCIVGITASCLIAGGVWLAYSRAMLLVHPVRLPIERTPAMLGLDSWQDVSFTTSDGVQIRGWLIAPSSSGNGATVIMAHGFGDNRTGMLAQAAMLSNHGYQTLLFDFRNHGESQGAMTTLGYSEVEDVRGAVQFLSTRSDVDRQRIGFIGHSMGAGTAIRAAARIPQIRAVIAESAYTSIEDNVADGVRGLMGLPPFPFAPLVLWFGERETQLDIRSVRPIDDIASISPRPILLVHGELDSLIPVRNSIQLYNAAREPKALCLIPNAGHMDLQESAPLEFEHCIVDFLARCDALARCNTP